MRGLPVSLAIIFAGKRDESIRAGMTAMTLLDIGTFYKVRKIKVELSTLYATIWNAHPRYK